MKIIINGKKTETEKEKTILEIARANGIFIPALCYHSDLEVKANCRVCVVEITQGKNKCLKTACSTKAQEGMVIKTETEEIRKLRKTNLELLFSQHQEECSDCVHGFSCEFKQLAREYKADIYRFKDRKKDFPVYNFGQALIFDSSKCIDCRNCVEMCDRQGVQYLEIEEKKGLFKVVPSKHRECIYCGQCLTHCPVGAFEAVGEFENIEKPLKDKTKTIVFQFAPAIRTSIGEEFGMKIGEVVTGRLVSAIKALGADYVFDVSVGADFTTLEEAKELIEKLKQGKQKILFNSCCPAWVRFLECYYPEFVSHLATARPPHIILGGLIKTYWAQKKKLNPKNIKVVSVMPCVAKKYEIERKEFLIDGLRPVDNVLTTRELAFLFKKHNINLKTIKPKQADSPLGLASGAGIIYGASGGVMESALRTAKSILENKRLGRLDWEQIRGQEQFKVANIEIQAKKMKMAVINGIGEAKKMLEQVKKNPKAYSCCEVMACLGGCIGGGGQPVPADQAIRQKRAQGLYQIDSQKPIRSADENPIVKKIYKEFLTNEKIIKKICHAYYTQNKN